MRADEELSGVLGWSTVHAGGRVLRYRQAGRGTVVMLLALSIEARVREGCALALAPHCRVVLPEHDVAATPSAFVDFLDGLGMTRALVAHTSGEHALVAALATLDTHTVTHCRLPSDAPATWPLLVREALAARR